MIHYLHRFVGIVSLLGFQALDYAPDFLFHIAETDKGVKFLPDFLLCHFLERLALHVLNIHERRFPCKRAHHRVLGDLCGQHAVLSALSVTELFLEHQAQSLSCGLRQHHLVFLRHCMHADVSQGFLIKRWREQNILK